MESDHWSHFIHYVYVCVCDSSSCYLTLKIIVIHSYSIPILSITVAGQFFLLHISFSYVVGLSTQKPLDSERFSCFPLSFKIFFLTCLLSFSPALEENYFQSKIPPVLLLSLYPTSNTHTHALPQKRYYISFHYSHKPGSYVFPLWTKTDSIQRIVLSSFLSWKKFSRN